MHMVVVIVVFKLAVGYWFQMPDSAIPPTMRSTDLLWDQGWQPLNLDAMVRLREWALGRP